MGRIWFWKPQWHWFGWRTLVPAHYGHDEYARRTILLGWTITGRVIIALWNCGDEECELDAAPRKAIAIRALNARKSTK